MDEIQKKKRTYAKKSSKPKTAETEAAAASEPVEPQTAAEAPKTTSKMTELEMREHIAKLEGVLDAMTNEGEGYVTQFGVTLKEGTVISDPFHTQNPVSFKKHPNGLRLSWCNPIIRNQIGWQGWTPVTRDSDIGENLEEYLNAVPARLEGVNDQDNFVRRGRTSILCTLPEEIFVYRQLATERESTRRMQKLEGHDTSVLRPDGSVVISGEGLVPQERPAGGFRFKHEKGDRAKPRGGEQEVSDLIPADEKAANRALHN